MLTVLRSSQCLCSKYQEISQPPRFMHASLPCWVLDSRVKNVCLIINYNLE